MDLKKKHVQTFYFLHVLQLTSIFVAGTDAAAANARTAGRTANARAATKLVRRNKLAMVNEVKTI